MRATFHYSKYFILENLLGPIYGGMGENPGGGGEGIREVGGRIQEGGGEGIREVGGRIQEVGGRESGRLIPANQNGFVTNIYFITWLCFALGYPTRPPPPLPGGHTAVRSLGYNIIGLSSLPPSPPISPPPFWVQGFTKNTMHGSDFWTGCVYLTCFPG